MNPHSDRVNDILERARLRQSQEKGCDPAEPVAHVSLPDSDSDALLALAQHLQTSSHLRVDVDFARRLERQILAHHATLHEQRTIQTRRSSQGTRSRRRMVSVRVALSLALLLLVVGAGLLVTVAQASDPTNPFYPLYHLVHQSSQTQGAATARVNAAQSVQRVQRQLDALGAVTDPAQHEAAYQQALANLEQAIQAANAVVTALQVSTERAHLEHALSALTIQTRHVLRSLLPQLTLSEQQMTTEALGTLGESVPIVQTVVIVVATPSAGTATVTITGRNLEPGAILVIDGREVTGTGTLQRGVEIFVVSWAGNQRPQRVGILNPDSTVALTTTIQMTVSSGTNPGKSNGSSGTGGKGSGKGNGGGKPTSTPTPPGNPPPVQH